MMMWCLFKLKSILGVVWYVVCRRIPCLMNMYGWSKKFLARNILISALILSSYQSHNIIIITTIIIVILSCPRVEKAINLVGRHFSKMYSTFTKQIILQNMGNWFSSGVPWQTKNQLVSLSLTTWNNKTNTGFWSA